MTRDAVDADDARMFRDVHRAAADDRTAAGACAEFRQCHPNGHRRIFPVSGHAAHRGPTGAIVHRSSRKVRNKGLSARALTTIAKHAGRCFRLRAAILRPMYHDGTLSSRSWRRPEPRTGGGVPATRPQPSPSRLSGSLVAHRRYPYRRAGRWSLPMGRQWTAGRCAWRRSRTGPTFGTMVPFW